MIRVSDLKSLAWKITPSGNRIVDLVFHGECRDHIIDLITRYEKACQEIQGALTYDPMNEPYKLKEWHAHMKRFLVDCGPDVPLGEKK